MTQLKHAPVTRCRNPEQSGLREHVAPDQWPTEVSLRTEQPRVLCSVSGCFHLCLSRALCSKHYQRWRRWGDPNKTLNPPVREPVFRGRTS